MAIIDSFDNKTEAVINPALIAPPIDGFPKVAVVAFNERFITALYEHYAPRIINGMFACISIPIYQITYEGRDIAVYCSTLGGPVTVGLLEEMITKGCEKLVFFGSCGVLDHGIIEKSLVIPTAAYRDEGTSYHYAPPSDYIEVMTAPRLAEIMSDLNLPYINGKTWTTDAFYRETRGNMKKRRSEGCITVEMECASIMAAAQFRGIEAYQFFYAADSLDASAWDSRTLGNLPQDVRERFLRIALEIAIRV
jgi:uridine phosphorylase